MKPLHPSLQWDIFCRVIDNFGDVGVCWRLSAQLAALGHRVRLWIDDPSALQWMAPEGCLGVDVRASFPPLPAPADIPADVIVETFGCDINPSFLTYSIQQWRISGRKPVWINLEHLSAESFVERSHQLASPIMVGPAAGWVRWFFYPGFTSSTGGLLREPHLMDKRQHFDVLAWRVAYAAQKPAAHPHPLDRWISLFCYEPSALEALLSQCALQPTHLLVTPGRAAQAVHQALQTKKENRLLRPPIQQDQLSISYLEPYPQSVFDEILWACDLNAVRGEDSLVRALWAGQALVWNIYPQDDNAHHQKLMVFLDWLQAPVSMRRFHATWNGLDDAPLNLPNASRCAEWTECVQAARARLLAQDDLVTQLVKFAHEKQ